MSKFFKCTCGSEVVQIERDIEVVDKNTGTWTADIYFAMFHYGTQNSRPTLREKLRHCWKILKTGKNFPDDIIMSMEEARSMGEYLIELTDQDKLKGEAEKVITEIRSTIKKC